MPNPLIARRRLAANRLHGPGFEAPEDVVAWFGAVQGQDYGPASWALGQRMRAGATATDIDAALESGRILRTHAMRPTWHFLHPATIRSVLALTSHRVHRLNAMYYHRLGLDAETIATGTDVLVRSLEGGQFLTRNELAAALGQAGIEARGPRLAYLVMHAELDALLVSGPRRGKQFTYALLDERVPEAPALDREAALADLTARYFASHGPAEPRDFAWWSGLTLADAREGLALVGRALERATIDGVERWWDPGVGEAADLPRPRIHLLPALDEYTVSYRNHDPIFDRALLGDRPVDDVFFVHVIARDGLLVGGWRREVEGRTVVVEIDLLVELDAVDRSSLEVTAAEYGRFIGSPVRVEARRPTSKWRGRPAAS